MKKLFSPPFRPLCAGLLVLATAVLCRSAVSSHSVETDPLSGVWGSESSFGSPVRGELTIDGRGGAWRAFVSGFQVEVWEKVGDIGFKLPGAEGEFRGHLDTADRIIHGQWIQPQGEMLSTQFASPVQLTPIGPSVWRGTVIPLDPRISIYISIRPSSNGKLTAFISNPEMNFFRRRVFAVTRDGTKVHLSANGQDMDGTYNENSDTLSLRLVDFMPPFQFTRRRNQDAVGFYARVLPDGAQYHYRKPLADNDGWATSSLSEVGLDEVPIAALINQVLTANLADNPLYIHSLLIARHGHLALEEYFYGFDEERVHDMRSASKTFAPVLVGLAKDHGAKLTPETTVYSLFSRYKSFENWDDRKQAMSLRDIMTMSAGNACDDNDDNSPGNEDRMQRETQQSDWYKYTLDLPMLRKPGGEDAIYCSADLNLVGGAVAETTGRWLPDLFEQYLAGPLQFGHYYLNLMPDGQAYMGGGAYLRPRDQLKLGQLFLGGGVWNGRRLISKQWVTESTSFHSRFAATYSLGQEHQYGYGWHIHNLKSGGKTYRVFAAEGNGGQFVIVAPDLDLVIGITGGSYGEFDKWYRWELQLVPQFIIPAATAVPSH